MTNTTNRIATARRLHAEWVAAFDAVRRNDTDANYQAEQAAYDAVVDYVEANDLNGSTYDPR